MLVLKKHLQHVVPKVKHHLWLNQFTMQHINKWRKYNTHVDSDRLKSLVDSKVKVKIVIGARFQRIMLQSKIL